MRLIYNGFDFSTIGELSFKQSRELEGAADQPQRARVTLAVRIEVFRRTYDENRQALEQIRPALRLPNALLTWTNDVAGTDYVNQTAQLVSDDAPEEWGEYHQVLNLVFSYYEQAPGGAANNVPLTFQKAGSPPVRFDIVNKWSHAAAAERFSPLRSQRRQVLATIRVEGQYFGDTTLPLADRRTALAAQAVAFNATMNGSEGQLVFGDGGSVFQGVVRIADWTCEVDQMVNAISFTFTAGYTLFPDEGNYATAEFNVEEKDEFNGQFMLAVTGKIQSQTEAAARTKLDAVLSAVLAARSYASGQRLTFDATASEVDADDGATFIELTFSATYRKWKTTNLTATAAGVPLGNINAWRDEVSTERFDPLRSQRLRTTALLTAAGTFAGDMALTLKDRRVQLLAAQRALKVAVTAADVPLVYGDFSQTVRVAQFTAEINQAETGIEWSLTASYTLFPAEGSYATVELTAGEKDDFTGQLALEIGGKVQAQSEAAARTKLAAVLAQQVADRQYTAGQQLALDTTPNLISANADGATFTELTFAASYRKWKATNQVATFKGTGTTARRLGNVNRWQDSVTTERFDPLRPHRQRATATLTASGTLAGDLSQSVTTRRAALLALQRQLKAELTCANGTLTYGDFTQDVRPAQFTAEINQAETGIDWSLSASYTLFPVEASYATVELTAAERDDFSGQLMLEISGKVQAQSEAAARTKLAAMLTQQVTERQYTGGQQLALDTTPNLIAANADGATFTELAFTASYRKWKTTNLKATVKNGSGQGVSFGNVNRWRERVDTQRFNPLRSQRERVTQTIEAAGTLAADLPMTLRNRRSQLLAMQRALKAAVTAADCILTYGDFTQTVRVTEFSAEINQAETGIEWSLTATYTLFPDETNYGTVDFTAAERDDYSGQLALTVNGKVQAQTEAAARIKLTALLATVLGQRGYDQSAQAVQLTTTPALLDANSDGVTFTELTFSAGYRRWKSTNQKATFQKTDGTKAVPFGNVNRWRDHYAAQRFNELRSERRHATGSVDASGTFQADASLSVTDRRSALLALQRDMKAEVNAADGVLTYGDWSQVVRVDDFQAEINQAETGIDWSLSASYSLFPNEGGYATAEFTVDQREDVESGDETLALAGRVAAQNGAAARAKLATLRTAVLQLYGWTLAQRLRADSTVSALDANGDRTTGIDEGLEAAGDYSAVDLTFSEEYRRRMSGAIVSVVFNRTDREEVEGQTLSTTFSGHVTASGPTVDAAYATALARARSIGANRESAIDSSTVFKGSTISQDQRQTRADNVTELVGLSFTYEYRSKLGANRAFIEFTSTVNRDMFGVDVETCSGAVFARDAATAQGVYNAQVRALYAARLIHSETTGGTVQKTQTATGFAGQHTRFEFSLAVFTPKPTGRTAFKYSLEVNRDLLTLDQRSVVQGSCYAVDRYAADAALAGLFTFLKLGNSVKSRRVEDRERFQDAGGSVMDVLLKLDFEEEFADRITGTIGVLEMELNEAVVYSGIRWSMQNLPFNGGQVDATGKAGGVSIPQPTGIEPGSREVSGSVTAGTLATAQAWALKQQALLTGDARGNHYPQPPKLATNYVFVPRINGIARGDGANVKLHRVSFTFSEILPLYNMG